MRKYVLAGKQHVLVRQSQRMYEEAIRKSLESAERDGKDIDQIYIIIDAQGYNVREHLCGGCIPATLDIARSFTVGVLPFTRNVTIVNSKLSYIWRI